MTLRDFSDTHLSELMSWFPDAPSCAVWAGPGFRFPFTAATFREDLHPELPSFVLLDDAGALLAFGQYYLREARCHLARLAVAPRARGRGTGAVLIREIARRGCRALETRECSLFVLESNTAARRLYSRLGFAPAPYPGSATSLGNILYLVLASASITGEVSHGQLRIATVADLPAIWEVRYAVTENTLTPGRISDEDVRREIEDTGRGWVIEMDGRVRAFAIGNGVNGNVWALFVHPEVQGLGLGCRLHDCMLEWFRTQSIRRLWLTTGADTRAHRFYANRGWQQNGESEPGEARLERDNLPASSRA